MEEVLISAGDEAVWPTRVSMFLWFTHCLSALLSLHLLVMKVLTHCLDVICMLSALGCLLDGLRRFFPCAFGIFSSSPQWLTSRPRHFKDMCLKHLCFGRVFQGCKFQILFETSSHMGCT